MLDDSGKSGLGEALAHASRLWRDAFAAEMDRRGFAVAAGSGGDLLAQLGPEGIPQGELGPRLGLSKQAVQQLLDRLEAAGAVQRQPDPADKRAKRVVPAAHGLEALAVRKAVAKDLDSRLRDVLGKKAAGRLRKALRKLDTPL